MTTVTIPALQGGTASVRLVEYARTDRQVLGFDGPEWATAYDSTTLDSGASFTLTPTADIALAGGGATAYRIQIVASGGRTGVFCVQVPDSDIPVELYTLVGADGIDPDDVSAQVLADVLEAAATATAQAGVATAAAGTATTQAGIATTQAGLSADSAEDAVAAAAYVEDHLATLVVLLSQDTQSATLGVGDSVVISEGTDPYPYVELEIS